MHSALTTIDLNCDCGESFGAWTMGADAAVLPWVSSANIACGFHAGDPQTMLRTIDLCLQHGVQIGAHPGHQDLHGFGRRPIPLNPDLLHAQTLYQTGALQALCSSRGARLHHVKPHGALYHQLAADWALAQAFTAAIRALDPHLLLYGPPAGALQHAAEQAGLQYCREGFIERGYAADGTLLARGTRGAVLQDPATILEQSLELSLRQRVRTQDGWLHHPVQTLCIHGDRADAATLAPQVHHALRQAGLRIAAPAIQRP